MSSSTTTLLGLVVMIEEVFRYSCTFGYHKKPISRGILPLSSTVQRHECAEGTKWTQKRAQNSASHMAYKEPTSCGICWFSNRWTKAALRDDLSPVAMGYSLPRVIESVSAPPR